MRYLVIVETVESDPRRINTHEIECQELEIDEGVLGLKLTETKGRYFPLAQVVEFTVEETQGEDCSV
jgi:hypothetical protein